MEEVPAEGVAWTPRQHYNAGLEISQEGGPWQDIVAHALMGVLAGLIEMSTTLSQVNNRYQEASRIRP